MDYFLETITTIEFIGASVLILGGTIAALLVSRRKQRAEAARARPGTPAPGAAPAPVPASADGKEVVELAVAELADHPKVRFSDVAGLDDAIDELREITEYLADPARFRAIGAELPRGILLHGEPGCGKTLLARALAGETGVPFFSVSASSFVEKYVGVGAARIRKLFEDAKATAPAIVFIDELDALGRRGTDGAQGEREFDHCLNQLLVELDGFSGSSGVLVIGATNRPELVDAALMRPGRIDRSVRIDRLDRDGREEALRLHAASRKVSRSVAWSEVAHSTAGLSAADLANVVNEAALLAARRHRPMVTPDDVEEAITRVHAGTRRARVLSREEKDLVAVHEGGHALLSVLLRGFRPPSRVSIVSRGGAIGKSVWANGDDREISTKRELLAQLILLLGGRAAELNTFGEPSSRAEDDLEHAAALGRQMVERWAMTGRFELAGSDSDSRSRQFEGSAGSQEVRALVGQAERAARVILHDHARQLSALAAALVEHETLTAQEVTDLAEGLAVRPHRAPLQLRGA